MTDQDTPPPAEITYDEFTKVHLRVGRVIEAERVPKSTKLFKMKVSFGEFERQILAGIGETFEPEAVTGKQYLFVTNLAPRKMMGLESHGMMLATGPDSKHLGLIEAGDSIPAGSSVG